MKSLFEGMLLACFVFFFPLLLRDCSLCASDEPFADSALARQHSGFELGSRWENSSASFSQFMHSGFITPTHLSGLPIISVFGFGLDTQVAHHLLEVLMILKSRTNMVPSVDISATQHMTKGTIIPFWSYSLCTVCAIM